MKIMDQSMTNKVPKRPLGNTGLEVSVVGMGGIPLQRCDLATSKQILTGCYNWGMNILDTARGYGASEALMGQALEELKLREHFVIATKSPAKDRVAMAADIRTSLENLRTDYIDLYQCHFIKDMDQYRQIVGEGGALEALKEAKSLGLIKHIGMTAHNKDVLMQAVKDSIWETVQFPFNMVEIQGLEAFQIAHARGIGILCMKPLAGGAIENATLAMRFITQNDYITCAIPGMDSLDQVDQNARAGTDTSPLSQQELVEISTFQSQMSQSFCRRCGYCGPCAVGIDIPVQFTLEGYLTRYDLKEWALMRLAALPKQAKDCIGCGICEPKCPYDLPIRDMMKRAAHSFEIAQSKAD